MSGGVSSSSFVAGAVAGGVDTFITMPLDTVKTKMQLQRYPGGMRECIRAIVASDGIAGLYYGFRPFLIQASGKAAVRFSIYASITQAVDATGVDRSHAPAKWSMACGLGAGMGEALLWTAPTERLKVLRQSTAGQGAAAGASSTSSTSISTILREQGVGGLYVGAGATAARQATSTAVRFATLDYIKALVCASCGYDKHAAPAWVTFLCGGTAGSVSAVLNNPIDVVKSRIQSGSHRGSMLSCVSAVYSERGVAGFAAGVTPRCIRLFASQAIQFTIVDKFMQAVRGKALTQRVSVAGRV